MIFRVVAIELCQTAGLSALFFKKRSKMGSIKLVRCSVWAGNLFEFRELQSIQAVNLNIP